MRFPVSLRLVLLPSLVFSVAGPALSVQEEPTLPEKPQETLVASLHKAYKLIYERDFRQARTELERAQTLAGGPCGECLLGMSQIYIADGKWKKAVETTREAIPLLSSPDHLSLAYNQLAKALVQSQGTRGLAEAEEALRQAMKFGGSWGVLARYSLAEVLYKAERWAEAIEVAQDYLSRLGPESSGRQKGQIVLCRARSHLPEEASPPEEGSPAEPKKLDGEGSPVMRPEIISQVKPVYPESARAVRVTGTVILEAIINQEGCVVKQRALKELPYGLTEAAAAAVREWVFKPATLDGKPVRVYYVLTVNFGF